MVPVFFLSLAVLVAFASVLRNDFVNWDDDANLTGNPGFRGFSPDHLKWMLTTFHMGNYQPLTWLSYAMDYELWDLHPGGYHLTNLLLHLASTLLFFFVLRKLLERFQPSESVSADVPAALGALLFALHPLRVESVAWATERKGVLSGVFIMGTLLAYLRMDEEERAGRSGRKWRGAALGLFVCSLLSKALGLLLPFVLFALDLYPLRRFAPGRRRALLMEKVPFLAAAALQALVTLQALGQVGLVRPVTALHPVERILQAGYGVCFYLWKTLAPVRLSALYPVPRPFSPAPPVFWGSVVLAAAISIVCAIRCRRFPALAVAWGSYVALLLPVLGLANDAPHLAADRYSYLACLPWPVLWAFGLRRRRLNSPTSKEKWTPMELGTLGMILVLGAMTFHQTRLWKSSITLWNQALKVDPANVVALNNRGTARAVRGDPAGALRDLDEALRLDPTFVEAWYNRGRIRQDLGNLDGAVADLSEAIRESPEYSSAYRLRSPALRAKGDAAGADRDLAEAKRLESAPRLRKGILGTIEPDFASAGPAEVQALNEAGNRRAAGGDFDGAIESYSRAIALDPGIAGIYNNRGNARASKNDQAGAIADYTEALRLDPRFAEAFANRGMSRALLGNLRGAQEDYSDALRLTPRDPDVLANRGMVRREMGDRAGAAADFESALLAAPPDWSRRPVVRNLLLQLQGR